MTKYNLSTKTPETGSIGIPVEPEIYFDPKEEAPVTEVKVEETPRASIGVEVHYPFDTGEACPVDDTVVFPPGNEKMIKDAIEKMPTDTTADNAHERLWKTNVRQSVSYIPYAEQWVNRLNDPDARFTQKPMFNNIDCSSRSAKFKPKPAGEVLRGRDAIFRAVQLTGQGTVFNVVLWNSGIRLTLTPPTESEIVEYYRQVMEDRINFGRATYGFVFSNITVITLKRMMDLIIPHIQETNVKSSEMDISDILNHISVFDIPSLIWGFICTMYPKGYNYSRPCVNSVVKDDKTDVCMEIFKEVVNVSKMQIVDDQYLTPWQKSHMASLTPNVRSLADIKRYKEEMTKAATRRVDIQGEGDDAIAIILKNPSIADHIDIGYHWVTGLTDMVNELMTMSADDNSRNEAIMKHGMATAMRQYRHYIDHIEIGSNTIEEASDIDEIVNRWSASDTIREKFFDQVKTYIDEATAAIIGIPVFECKVCAAAGRNGEQKTVETKRHVNYIAIEVYKLFFALVSQRMRAIASR